MKMKFVKNSIISMGIAIVIGFILIFSSGSIGQKRGDWAITANGGSMDTSQYERIIEATTSNLRTVGIILSLIGGTGFLISGYTLYKELD